MKQKLIGTLAGRVAMRARGRLAILNRALFNEESAGMAANDWIAGHLVAMLCRPRHSFLDVGAHIGSVTAAVRQYDASVKIVAVEAVPEKAAKIRAKFPNIELHDCAVGEQNEGQVKFFVNTKKPGFSSLGKSASDTNPDLVEISVSIRRLDSLVTADDVDVIKIDVEGAELGALRGSVELIARCRPTIMFESGLTQDYGLGYTKAAMWEFFAEHDYDIFVPNRVAHQGPGLTLDGFEEAHFYPRRTTNYFAIPTERRGELRDRARTILQVG